MTIIGGILGGGAGGGGGLQNVVEDVTPQLGGALDVNGQKIVSVANGNIDIEPNGTGDVLLGNFTINADATIGAGQDNYVLTYDHAAGTWGPEASGVGAGCDTTAIHAAVSGEIAAVTEKAGIVVGAAADVLLIEDSEASNAKKRVERQNLVGCFAYSASVNDDAVFSIDFGGGLSAAQVIVTGNNGSNRGIFSFRANASSPHCTAISATNITGTTGALTGTTGADGTVTLSAHTDNKLYLENRTGGAVFFVITVFRGQHY